MLSDRLLKTMNEQINHELFSAYLYLAMAAQFAAQNLKGFAHWMQIQAREETGHALRLFSFINDRGGRVILKGVEAPPESWASPLAAFEAALAHEKKVTGLIHKLVDQAQSEKDHAAAVFLQWFVTEQVEEEASALEIVEKLRLVADSAQGLLMLDGILGQRAG